MNVEELRSRFAELRVQGKRHKDAAAALGLSEGEAIAAHMGAHDKALHATQLKGPWVALLQTLEAAVSELAARPGKALRFVA